NERGELVCWRRSLQCRDRPSLRPCRALCTSRRLPGTEACHATCRLRQSESAASWPCLRVSCACLLTPLGFFVVVCVLDDIHVGKHHQALLHHFVQEWHECLELLLRVNDGEQDRPVM